MSMHRCMVYRRDIFFFSSRRRHTRLQGDWSSDVCSSDLELLKALGKTLVLGAAATNPVALFSTPQQAPDTILANLRSEENTSELQSLCNLVCRLLLEKINEMLRCTHIHLSIVFDVLE